MSSHWIRLCLVAWVSYTLHAQETPDDTAREQQFITSARQLTFEGKRAGEGYFSSDGTKLIFQSERVADNPFCQIYLLDLTTGDTRRVSPGTGKTTCAWIHPSGDKALFASTHLDPETHRKQQEELDFRASGKERRYSWDYDPAYEIFEKSLPEGEPANLTNAVGYDAEGSWSPDGRLIVFASNREAYNRALTDAEKELLDRDPSYFMDLYVMNADGSNVQRITASPGYDGGPFFSPDGSRIIWRRFSEDGATAEVYTAALDGTDSRQITRLGAMSWAPYYHPSGKYIVFTTNKHGFDNFELYLVDTAGEKEPVRVTYTPKFDGLPVFSPDGNHLCWTSNRTASGTSQLYLSNWNHDAALAALGSANTASAPTESEPISPSANSAIVPEDMKSVVTALASDEMAGRLTGTEGEQKAVDYVAGLFKNLGLVPAGDNGTYFQSFDFTAGVSLGGSNAVTVRLTGTDTPHSFVADEDWRPLAFSSVGTIEASTVVFAGYGIVAPTEGSIGEYDSYAHLDVTDKWVLLLRYVPENVSVEERAHYSRFASLRYKAMVARDKGARGIIVVTGPNTQTKDELVKLAFDASLSGAGIGGISVTNAVADVLFSRAENSLAELQSELDNGIPVMGFDLPSLTVSATIDIVHEKSTGKNVLGRLQSGSVSKHQAILVGAHVDHLGEGAGGASSLARPNEVGMIHYGADDNASGVAGMLEIAAYFAGIKLRGEPVLKKDVVFAAWSGEELGLLGSSHYANQLAESIGSDALSPSIAAYINMDMIGRLRDNLALAGVGTSSIWPGEIERANVPVGLTLTLQQDAYLPTDATSLFMKGVPFLSAYTGAHEDYHTPRDTAEKINYEGAAKIAQFLALVTRSLATADTVPDYIEQTKPEDQGMRASLRAYLGTIPDYAQTDVQGVKLGGVSKGGPAEAAGIRSGDVIVKVGGKTIGNIYDYTYAIEALKVGEEIDIVVLRDNKQESFRVVAGSRE
ncbi:MAG: hypothetical protein AMXMBFR84_21830 [Candidatus Hydrogenedentota bacterium]